MKVTIITPTYNSELFIRDNLESVKRQRYPDIEHIIVDNLSSDKTRDICAEYNVIIFSQKDNSMYEALNYGIENSTGDILTFLNSDDLYPDCNTIEKIVEFFNINQGVDVVYGNCMAVDKDLNYLYIHRPRSLSFDFAIKRIFVVIHQSVFLKKQVFYKYGLYDLNLKYMADCEYWIRLLKHGVKFEYIDDILSMFRRHENNLSLNKEGVKESSYICNKYGYKYKRFRTMYYLFLSNISNFDYLKYTFKKHFKM